MQLTKQQIQETQIIVTTPEKWDVMTRKNGDGALIHMVRLLILDEVYIYIYIYSICIYLYVHLLCVVMK